MSLLLIDLDGLKRINDQEGHTAGDRVLRGMAAAIRNTLRKSDYGGRWGGDEFVIVLVGTGEEGAQVVGEKVRLAVQDTGRQMGYPEGFVTASIGVAEYRPDKKDEDVLVAADRALYRAKAAGRNQVATGGEP